jgi:hypothetical protein
MIRSIGWIGILGLAVALVACGDDSSGTPDGGGSRRDGSIDASDRPDRSIQDCEGVSGPENTPEACSNGCDDDDDTFVDCDDFECEGVGSCPAPDGGSGMGENTDALCSNGRDDDGDSHVDCDDFECEGLGDCTVENSNARCSNEMDDDGDDLIDCDDEDCQDRAVCSGERTNAACSDEADNDGDDLIDCMDPSCQDEAVVVCDGTTAVEVDDVPSAIADACTDESDGDEDGFVDCADNGCLLLYAECEPPQPEQSNATCSDGIDNDGDGDEDCADRRCQGEGIAVCDGEMAVEVDPADYQTESEALCSDGVNNDDPDCDPETDSCFVDCDDFSCSQNPDVTICQGENSNARCSNGEDEDGDDNVDCADFDCLRNPFVTVCDSGFERCSDGLDNDGNGFADCDDFSCNPPEGSPLDPSVACF